MYFNKNELPPKLCQSVMLDIKNTYFSIVFFVQQLKNKSLIVKLLVVIKKVTYFSLSFKDYKWPPLNHENLHKFYISRKLCISCIINNMSSNILQTLIVLVLLLLLNRNIFD